MNNEPVAWINKTGNHGYLEWDKDDEADESIPLYIHPVEEQDESFDRTASHMAGEYVSWTSCVACGQRVTSDSIHTCSPQLKQLTDEEIRHIQAICHLKDVGYDGFIMRFARAILRKAQTK